MFEALRNAARAVKQGAVEAGGKAYINRKIEKFGTVTNLQIDTRNKTILIEALLKGEDAPIQVRVGNYELNREAQGSHVILRQFDASREWVAGVLNEFVAGRRFAIPSGLTQVL